jgi:hypothetical protein
LEVRGYPLPMNVGCGTIRGLGLDLPHFGGADHEKIRLTARDVAHHLPHDYQSWLPVAEIHASSRKVLEDNIYCEPDPCHPAWNAVWRTPANLDAHAQIIGAAEILLARTHDAPQLEVTK